MNNSFDKIAKAATLGASIAFGAAAAQAGSTNPGPYEWSTVGKDNSHFYNEYFTAGSGSVYLYGNCPSDRHDIDLWVYDQYGNTIGKSTSYGCDEEVHFYLNRGQNIRIQVENENHPYATGYELVTE